MSTTEKNPREAEARGEKVTVPFRGHTFECERDREEWSVDLLESLEEGKSVGIVRGFLGPAQWRTVKSMDLKSRDLDELSDAIARAMGFGGVGESPASVD